MKKAKQAKTQCNKLFIIGLDGATYDLIHPWIKEGVLPNIQRLIETGASSTMVSTIQPVTAPAWTSFLTGVNQGKHGLYDFIRRKEHSYDVEVTNSSHIHAPTIFDIASQLGKTSIVINVPYTYPPKPINGIVVGGPFAPSVNQQLTYPQEFFDTLIKLVPNYFVMPEYNARHTNPLQDYATNLISDYDVRLKLCSYLIDKVDWDIFMIVFMAIDEGQHAFWHFHELNNQGTATPHGKVLRDLYIMADESIGILLELLNGKIGLDKVNVIIASDHGAGPLHAIINLNQWLQENGFLYYIEDRKNITQRLRANIVQYAANIYRQYVPVKIRSMFRNKLSPENFEKIKGQIESTLLTSTVDWEKTKVYALGAGGNLYINLKGREPNGIVEPGEEYNKLVDQVIAALLQIKDPDTGMLLVKKVYRKEEIYQGPYVNNAPDLIIEWVDYGYWGRGRYDNRAPLFEKESHMEFTTLPLTGAHRPEGVFIASGPDILPGHMDKISIMDVAPTMINLLGINTPEYMDGNSLRKIISPKALERIKESDTYQFTDMDDYNYTAEDEKTITDHLKALGYL